MKRQLLVTLVMLLCTFRSFSETRHGQVILVPGAALDLSPAPFSVCRYKKPFPFQCVQLIKKRLSNPPDTGRITVFISHIKPLASSDNALSILTHLPVPAQPKERETALLLFRAIHWHPCGIKRNVFHPPPFAA